MQKLEALTSLKPLPQLKPLICSDKRACLKYPSDLELLCVSVSICHEAHLILTNQKKIKKGLIIEDYLKKTTELMAIQKDYHATAIPTMRELNKMMNDFNIKRN